MEIEALSNAFVDEPFSARIRQDGARLILKDVKIAGLSLLNTKIVELATLLRTVVVGNYQLVSRNAPSSAARPTLRSSPATY
ncbi:MAG TPA: hypothetical protein EYG57_09295 [Planctomycetes bacterium]|nr:hypothetical protein [Planctomycetota bacterium]